MQVYDQYMAGFDIKKVNNWIGITTHQDTNSDLEQCQRQQ